MKRRLTAAFLTLTLALTGCTALLDREYFSAEVHDQRPEPVENSSAIRVENYQELLSAILFLVKDHQEKGTIQLYNYKATTDVNGDLERACNEVHHEDPLGNYAVEYISRQSSRILLYYQADVTIQYRRTLEQMNSILPATGSSAIRSVVSAAMREFAPERVLRVSYFTEDAAFIATLAHQAYYDTPEAAFGMPKATVNIYPEPVGTGDTETAVRATQRIVEVLLAYPEDPEDLRDKQEALLAAADTLLKPVQKQDLSGEGLVSALYTALREVTEQSEETGQRSPTPYAALVEGAADSEGLALAFKLLCDRMQVECTVVEGTLDGAPHFWNIVTLGSEHRHVEPGSSEGLLLTDQDLEELGAYDWNAEEYPVCGEPQVLTMNDNNFEIPY